VRILALDHGEVRCGCAVSDPSGTIATPLDAVLCPETRKGLARVMAVVDEVAAERVVVGLPVTLAGEEGLQARRARAFAERLRERLRDVPVDLYDERLTTRMAEATQGAANADSRAAAYLLESYLAAHGTSGT